MEQRSRKIWKIRTVKNYPDAHNHIFVGEVLDMESCYLRLDCKTYHFGRSINGLKDIRAGGKNVRIVPWNRIEIINELSGAFNYSEAELTTDKDCRIILTDGKLKCVIAFPYDNRY